MSRYRDFDAAVDELEAIEFTVKGKRYTLEKDPPCDVILRLLSEDRINDPSAVPEILESILGKGRFDEMRQAGLGLTQLALLSEWLMEQMGFSAVGATANALGAEVEASGNG
jgi:hypothetical protein